MARAWRKPPWPGRTSLSRPAAALTNCSRPAFTSCSRGRYTTLGMAAVRMSGPPYSATAAASPRMCWGSESHPAKLCCPPAYWLYGEVTAATASTSARPGRYRPDTDTAAATASCLAGTSYTTAAATSSCGSSLGFGASSPLTSCARLSSTSCGTGLGCSSSSSRGGNSLPSSALSHSSVLLTPFPPPAPTPSCLPILGRAEVEISTDCGATDGRGGTEHNSLSDGGYDWGGPRTLSPSPVDRTGSGTNYGVATTRLLTHSATTTQEKTEPGGGIHDAISATPDSYITTEEECEPGSYELGLTSLLIRSPRNIAFRCGMKPSSSTYIMCSSHYWLSRFL